MHPRKRIELIIEKMAYRRAGRVFTEAGASGWTVVPALAGSGKNTLWQRDQDISGSRDLVVMVCVCREEVAMAALEKIGRLLGDHIGVVSMSDVTVIRPDRF